jgi:hypothetical protein
MRASFLLLLGVSKKGVQKCLKARISPDKIGSVVELAFDSSDNLHLH